MLTVYYQNNSNQGCILRPSPLVTITQAANRNELGSLGSSYTITLTGTIIASEGSPYYTDNANVGPDGLMGQIGPNWDTDSTTAARPHGEVVPYGEKLGSIIDKQNVIRELFAMDGQRMELSSIDNNAPKLAFYPSVESVTFDEGLWVDICRYTVVLNASSLLKPNGEMLLDSRPFTVDGLKDINTSITVGGTAEANYQAGNRLTEKQYLAQYGGFVSSFEDSWSLVPDESLGGSDAQGRPIRLGYRLSRTMSATGITKYIADYDGSGDGGPVKRYDAWQMARDFVKKSLLKDYGVEGSEDYPQYQNMNTYASGFIDLANYTGYNNSRTESMDPAAGTYTIEDTWTIASGLVPAYETFEMNITTDTGNAYVGVVINGTITGATSLSSADQTAPEPPGDTAYDRALSKYYTISNNGQFGINSIIYKRANGAVEQYLNSQPASITLSTNEYTGQITYSITFDNRPTNIFTGVMSENIAVTDTNPGDVYSAIPVLGRKTGPVLQYLDMRTAYQRSVTIEIQLDYTDIGYGENRANLLMTKPSLNDPIKTELDQVIKELSPAQEPGIRKYFIDAPTESWSPRDGRYSLNLSWTYELDN